MLVGDSKAAGSARRWLAGIALAGLSLPPLSLSTYLLSGTEVVKLRNAALLQGELGATFDWTAPPPADFSFDKPPFDPYFVDIGSRLGLAALPDDWARALAISRHLLGSHAPLIGGPIQADLRRTHLAIIVQGTGYCADFVRVFMAIASAAGMQVRAWAFSFDGFGGNGHVFPEIWNRQAGRWQLMDLYDNYSFAVGTDSPLSAAQFRQTLLTAPETLRLLPLDARVRPGWEFRAKALAYFQRGVDEWYLLWGSNVLGVEQAVGFRALRPLSFQLAQVGAVMQGVYPGVRPLTTATNAKHIDALRRTRQHLLLATAVMAIGVVCALLWLFDRRSRAAAPGANRVGR